MKKVLLTTTALVMTAGVAAAEVSLSGTAGVSATSVSGANASLTSGVDLDMKVSATAGNGMTMSATVDLGEGQLIDYNDDFAIDNQCATAETGAATSMDAAGAQVAATNNNDTCGFVGSSGAPAITLGYNGITVVVDAGGIDDLYDDAQHDDVSVAMNVGGLDTTITMDTDATDSHGSYKVAYKMGDLTATLTGSTDPGADTAADAIAADAAPEGAGATAVAARAANDYSGTKIALSYAMGDLTLSGSTDDGGDLPATHTAGFSYGMGDLAFDYTIKNASEEGWKDYDAKVTYSAGALTASYATDEVGVSKIIAEYDMGGGATLFASSKTTKGTNNFQTVGMNFKF
jgi:outer membrane protein OmpU